MGLINYIGRLLEFILPSDRTYRNKSPFSLPSGGVMKALSTAAAGWGSWVELLSAANNTQDRIITGLIMRVDTVGEVGSVQLGTGASGSESPKITAVVRGYTAEDCLVVLFSRPTRVSKGTRIAARCFSNTDTATVDVKATGFTGLGVGN